MLPPRKRWIKKWQDENALAAAHCLVTLKEHRDDTQIPRAPVIRSIRLRCTREQHFSPQVAIGGDLWGRVVRLDQLAKFRNAVFFNWVMSLCVGRQCVGDCHDIASNLKEHTQLGEAGTVRLTRNYYAYNRSLMIAKRLRWYSMVEQEFILGGDAFCFVSDFVTTPGTVLHDRKSELLSLNPQRMIWCTQHDFRVRVVLQRLRSSIERAEFFPELQARFRESHNLEFMVPFFGFTDEETTIITRDIVRQLFAHNSLFGIFIVGLLMALTGDRFLDYVP